MEDTKERDFEGNEIELEPADNEPLLVQVEPLNWRDAGKVLKAQKDKYENDFTIDSYFIKIKIDGLRERYNSKERTAGLHAEIVSLSIEE